MPYYFNWSTLSGSQKALLETYSSCGYDDTELLTRTIRRQISDRSHLVDISQHITRKPPRPSTKWDRSKLREFALHDTCRTAPEIDKLADPCFYQLSQLMQSDFASPTFHHLVYGSVCKHQRLPQQDGVRLYMESFVSPSTARAHLREISDLIVAVGDPKASLSAVRMPSILGWSSHTTVFYGRTHSRMKHFLISLIASLGPDATPENVRYILYTLEASIDTVKYPPVKTCPGFYVVAPPGTGKSLISTIVPGFIDADFLAPDLGAEHLTNLVRAGFTILSNRWCWKNVDAVRFAVKSKRPIVTNLAMRNIHMDAIKRFAQERKEHFKNEAQNKLHSDPVKQHQKVPRFEKFTFQNFRPSPKFNAQEWLDAYRDIESVLPTFTQYSLDVPTSAFAEGMADMLHAIILLDDVKEAIIP